MTSYIGKVVFVLCVTYGSIESQSTLQNATHEFVAVPVNTSLTTEPTSTSVPVGVRTTATSFATANATLTTRQAPALPSNSSLDVPRSAQGVPASSSPAMSSTSIPKSATQQLSSNVTTPKNPTTGRISSTMNGSPSVAPFGLTSTGSPSRGSNHQGTTPRQQAERQGRADAVSGTPSAQAQGSNSGVSFSLSESSGSPPKQTRVVWDALKSLQLLDAYQTVNDMIVTAVGGVDYPIYATIPETSFRCDQVKSAGFYADPEGSCQVFRRCDLSGNMWSFLCPNMTVQRNEFCLFRHWPNVI
ncbi:hypothetical protein RvY_15921 [Ramazzottius varieornatus]|uniref:Chitin-binding type-2 domain-containing protein n=1 Tax=Ramazzottius varieornatus TaxID=947166 RepID=A0A1D1VWM0_RAMVA|nr:hypothetical protein RvY_15921 [Ramazzottius varieornatus]